MIITTTATQRVTVVTMATTTATNREVCAYMKLTLMGYDMVCELLNYLRQSLYVCTDDEVCKCNLCCAATTARPTRIFI